MRKSIATIPPTPTHRPFEWTDVATTRLEEIIALLASNPILAAPNIGEPMLLYIPANTRW